MDLISLIVVLVVVGVIMWLINTYVPMQPQIKKILNIAVIIFVLLWLVFAFLDTTSFNTRSLRLD